MGGVERELGCALRAAAAATSLNDLGAALSHVRAALGASRVLLYRYPEPERLVPIAGDLMPVIEDYTESLYRQDACHHAARDLEPRPRIVRDHQLIDRRLHLASAPYNEYYRRYEIDHFACIWLTSVPYAQPGMVSFLVGRSHRQGDFDDASLERLQLVLPAFVGAVERVVRIGLDRELYDAVLDAASIRPCFALDEACRVIWASASAQRLVGPILAHGALPDPLVATARRLWREAGAAGEPDRPHRRTPVVAVRVPCGATALRAELSVVGSSRRVVVVALDAQAEHAVVTALAERHGLTVSECDVLGWLAHGLSNRDIAARSDVSIETVRTHVKRVFRKLGVATRTEAAMLVRRRAPGNITLPGDAGHRRRS